MISVSAYLGQHGKGHEDELTEEVRANAAETCRRANLLLEEFGEDRELRSGWRPAAVNAAKGGATKSKHMTGQAVDIEDNDGKLDAWCNAHLEVLERIGIWMEAEAATSTWAHMQTIPPKSGRRFFYP